MVKLYRTSPGNFGDDLNEILLANKLGNKFEGNVFLNVGKQYDTTDDDVLIVAIGTILNRLVPESGKKIVLGAGTGYGETSIPDDTWDIKFVRGPLTAKKLELDKSGFITDPAILLADEVISRPSQRYRFGYVPHHGCANKEWEAVCQDLNILYIDPRKSYAEVMEALLSCEVIIAEAMHGAIVADAMRVPWVPVRTAKKINAFKWQDWCGSLELGYEPLSISPLWDQENLTALKSVAQSIKKKAAYLHMLKVMKTAKPILSKNSVFEDKLTQVRDVYSSTFESLS